MQKWEYEEVNIDRAASVRNVLDEWGQRGWEAVAPIPDTRRWLVKRPLVDEEPERDYSVNRGSGYV